MSSRSAYARRRARLQGIFGTDDSIALTIMLRERRATTLAALLRQALTAVLPEWGGSGLGQPRRRRGFRPGRSS